MVAELNKCYLNQVAGFNCCGSVSSLQQARDHLMAAEHPIDLVLLDVFMRQDNGLDLLPVLREFSEHTDVIVISSATDVNTIKKALQYGVVDYLIKPFQFSRFEEALSTYREKQSLLGQREYCAQEDVDSLLRRSNAALPSEKNYPKDSQHKHYALFVNGFKKCKMANFRLNRWRTLLESHEYLAVSI